MSQENKQSVNLYDDLHLSSTSESDSSDVYCPSPSESANEEMEVVQENEINVRNNERPRSNKRRGKGRNKIADSDKTRKRKRNPSAWIMHRRYEARSKGNPFISTSKKFVPGKSLKPACSCKRKCKEKFPESVRLKIFQDFYKLDRSSQNQFIAQNFVEVEKKVERRRQDQQPSRRQFSLMYYLHNGGQKIQVCLKMFLNTLDIRQGKIKILSRKKRESTSGSICPNDERGKHGNHHKVNVDDVALVEDHIKRFPSYISHYSRSHTEKKYLSQDLNIAKMYRLYKDECILNNIQPQLESFYRKIFVEKFNLSFHRPSNDTCGKCDKYKMKINNTSDPEEKTLTQERYNDHLTMAEQAYEEKRKDKTESLQNETTAFISFDLEKCLPTPLLQNNVSFYKRSLWTYNLTIYSLVHKKKHAVCYVWDESVGGRGGQEIASCLRHCILSLPYNITTINMFSDCCTGQTRNIYVSVMLSLLIEDFIKNGRMLTINHKFLEPGHTHLEADTIHAAIEKVKKNTTAKIELPRDWANLIRLVPRHPSIEVIEIPQKDLLNFENVLKGYYVHRKINNNNESIQWLQIKWLQYRTEFPAKVLYKNSFNSTEDFNILDLSRKKKAYVTRANTSSKADNMPEPQIILKPLHSHRIPLPEKKIKDLKELMDFMSETSKSYYQNLVIDPELSNEEYLPDERVYEDD